MKPGSTIPTSQSLRGVKYEIRGRLARRALELARQGYEILSLNIGNPARFGFRTPETMRLAMIGHRCELGRRWRRGWRGLELLPRDGRVRGRPEAK